MSKKIIVPLELINLKAPSKYDQDDTMFKPVKLKTSWIKPAPQHKPISMVTKIDTFY
jgi:hypothetical protein